MNPFTPYMIQRALGVTVDGQWGPETEKAARKFLGNPKDETGKPWGAKRLIYGVQQKIMADAGITVSVDGLIGPATVDAFEAYAAHLDIPDRPKGLPVAEASMFDSGLLTRLWSWLRTPEKKEPAPVVLAPAKRGKPAVTQPTTWPRQADVESFYGPHGKVPLVKVKCPWQLELSWEPQTKVGNILIHEKLAGSLAQVLDAQLASYGEDGLRALGLHKYGGSYNDRPMRGSAAWSMHAYGCAIDWDPDANQLNWNHTKARLAKPDAEQWFKNWEAAGWVSLGRERDYDWMHVQAARL